MMKSCLFTLLVSLLASTAASAQEPAAQAEPKAEALAKEAYKAVLEHCADAGGRDSRRAAESVAVLGDVWARVRARAEASRTVPLQYWLGVIGQCLHQETRAAHDLDGFIKAHKGSGRWGDLIADAEERIGRLKPREKKRRPKNAAINAAINAAARLDQYCADVATGKAIESAQARSAVGTVLTEVSAAHDESGKPYLLYWRGRLELCLDREDRAEDDLRLFLETAADDAANRTLIQEARALLGRLSRP
jgi:hypothetical protein